jgi:anti-anti-sigma factor
MNPPFADISLLHEGRRTLATLTGEIDLGNAHDLFAAAHDDLHRTMIIDLTGVRFMDSSAINELVHLSRGRTLGVVAPTGGQPRTVLEMTRIVDVIATYETVAAALSN